MSRLVPLALVLLAPALPPGAQAGPAAVVSQVRGEVTLLAPGDAAGHPVRPLMPLGAGSTLRLARGAEAVVICAGDRAVRETGPADWLAGPEGCAAGRPLAASTYARLVPADGRVRDFHGSLLAEAPSRNEDNAGTVPTLLAPRSTQRGDVSISEPAPAIRWAAVHGALVYELELLHGGNPETARVEIARIGAAGADCGNDFYLGRLCTAPWPWAPLAPGKKVTLKIRAETADPDRRIRYADPSSLRLAGDGARRTVERELAALESAGLPEATHQLLRAAVYAEAKLYNETAAALAASLADRPQAAVAVRLGDLYLGLGLGGAAQAAYGHARNLLPPRAGEDETRAAVHLGLGRLYARRENPGSAAVRELRRAETLYRRAGWAAKAETAAAEAARVERTLR